MGTPIAATGSVSLPVIRAKNFQLGKYGAKSSKQRTAHTAHGTRAHAQLGTSALNGLGTRIQEGLGTLTLALPEPDDAGATPYFLRELVRAEQDERTAQAITPADYGKRWRATFRYITGDAPNCRPGDRVAARVYWQKVVTAMQKGGWSPSEWQYLYRAQRTWGKRWRGQDARFEVAGTRPGRLSFEDRDRIRTIEMTLGITATAKAKRAGAGR